MDGATWAIVLFGAAFVAYWIWWGMSLRKGEDQNQIIGELDQFLAANEGFASELRPLEVSFAEAFRNGHYSTAVQAATTVLEKCSDWAARWQHLGSITGELSIFTLGPLVWRGVSRAMLGDGDGFRSDSRQALELLDAILRNAETPGDEGFDYLSSLRSFLEQQVAIEAPNREALRERLLEMLAVAKLIGRS